MYNLYTYEKKVLENAKKQSEDSLKKELAKKRKKEIIKLSKNYENRMKDFIFSMCEKPVILRKNSLQDDKTKTSSQKNFKFGEFKTVKQRLEIMEAYKNKLKAYEDKRKNIEKKRNILKIKNHRDFILIQPEMRFNSRTKLEKIIEKIKKNDIANVDMYNLSLLEHNKKMNFNGVKKVKEFYNLIDKDDLKDEDIQKIIQQVNDVEQSESNNHYNLNNYREWKYHHIITNNENALKKEAKKKKIVNSKEVLQIMGKEDNKIKTKNEYEILVKDDFKTHFKGAEQFIELMDYKDKYYNELKQYPLSRKRAMSSLRLKSTDMKNWKNFAPVQNRKYKSSRNIKYIKMKDKRGSSAIDFDFDRNKYNLLSNKSFKKDYSFKDLSEDSKKKKIGMINSMNKEIKKSISKDFMNKYNSYNLYDNSCNLYIPKGVIFQNFHKFAETKKDENLNQKFSILSEEISREKRKINNEKYKAFVKRFTRSIFGFGKKEIQDKVDKVKADNQIDYVVIEGKVYPKKNIKKVGELIFRKCNYYNNKIKPNS